MDTRRFDVVILGGGTAGCVLAARLSENPERRVFLVEAGPDYGPYADVRWPEDIVDGRQLAFSHSWETDREDRSQLRAKILGGCSAHNACVVLEGAPDAPSRGGRDLTLASSVSRSRRRQWFRQSAERRWSGALERRLRLPRPGSKASEPDDFRGHAGRPGPAGARPS